MYLEYYQLAQKPFQINTDPAFLWFGEKHKEALATLKYGILENKNFLLLTGDVGVGKTTIINALLKTLDKNDMVAVVNDPKLENLDFFIYIAEAFGLPINFPTKGRFLLAFWNFLLDCHYQGKKVLLIIDESQLLSHELLEEIRLFSNLEKNGSKLINIFFVGQLEFNDILLLPENKAIRQRITVNYNIPPLSLEETEKYIEYRLAVAGTRKKIFDKGAIHEIFQFSRGYPRLINILADRALLTGFITSTKQIPKKIIKECAQELDISLASKANPQSHKKNQENTVPHNTYYTVKYMVYTAIVFALFAFIYALSGLSGSVSLLAFPKIQALLPEIISKKQNEIQPKVLPQTPSTVITPAPLPEPLQTVSEPTHPPESSPVEEQSVKTESISDDKPTDLPENNIMTRKAETPLEILVISFERDSLEISANSLAELEEFADAVLRRKTVKIIIRGYTDSSGSSQYNKKLAGFRATSVKNILAGKGIALDKINIASQENTKEETSQDQGTRRVEVEALNE